MVFPCLKADIMPLVALHSMLRFGRSERLDVLVGRDRAARTRRRFPPDESCLERVPTPPDPPKGRRHQRAIAPHGVHDDGQRHAP